jgi:flavin reductase (DIM6/NTAB) family NADH-FMN oxidoreductase RutF
VDLSNICSADDKYDQRFNDKNWNLDDVPFLANAQSNIFCSIDNVTSFYTHSIIVGLVEDSKYKNEIKTLTYVDGEYS